MKELRVLKSILCLYKEARVRFASRYIFAILRISVWPDKSAAPCLTLSANFLSTRSGLPIGPDSSVLASHWLFLDPPFWKVVFLQVQNKTDENLVSFTEKLFMFKLSPGSSATLKLKYLTIIFATFLAKFCHKFAC